MLASWGAELELRGLEDLVARRALTWDIERDLVASFVDEVEIHGGELSVASTDGAGVIAGVAVALNSCGVPVRSLTLRTPTLDDVFLNVTGSHLAGADETIRDGGEEADG